MSADPIDVTDSLAGAAARQVVALGCGCSALVSHSTGERFAPCPHGGAVVAVVPRGIEYAIRPRTASHAET